MRRHQLCGAADRLNAAQINRRNPPEGGLSFSAFSLTNPQAFTQDVRSWALPLSVRQPTIIRHQPNANEMCICSDYQHYQPLWHIQPAIYMTYSLLEVIWQILIFIEPLQLLNISTQQHLIYTKSNRREAVSLIPSENLQWSFSITCETHQ